MSVATELVTYCENGTLWSLSDYLYIPLPVETEISDVPLQPDSSLDGYLPSQMPDLLWNTC